MYIRYGVGVDLLHSSALSSLPEMFVILYSPPPTTSAIVMLFIMRPFFAFRQKSLFITGRTSIACQKKNQNIFLYQGCLFICLFICVIQHPNWPRRSTILNAHGTNDSPDGLCTRTHTNEAFSCRFCCNSFTVDRARRGNVCL